VVVVALLAGALCLLAVGCGGGGSDSAGGETTAAETTETADTTETTGSSGGIEETDGSFAPDSKLCKEINNQGSPLNIAASTGDFESAADRWEELLPEVPAAQRVHVKVLIEAYRLIDEDPAGYGVLDKPKYKAAQQAVNDFTGTACSSATG
jgi:hypothetical protein